MKLYVIDKSETRKGKKTFLTFKYVNLDNVRNREILKEVMQCERFTLNEDCEKYGISEVMAQPHIKYPFLLMSPVGILLGMLSHDILVGIVSLIIAGVVAEVFNSKDAEAANVFNKS